MDFSINLGAFTSEQNFKPLDTGTTYDVLILGGGPAGMSAAIYCMRKGLGTGLIVREVGGQVAETAGIENFLGFNFINGIELVDKFREQVLKFSIGYEEGMTVRTVIDEGLVKKVILADGREFKARALIITTGKSARALNVPGEAEFKGKGVAYCAICDAPFFKEKRVVVVGGGNSGIEAAIDLARLAEQVTVVQFLPELTADRILVDRLREFPNVDYFFNHEMVKIEGEQTVTSATVRNRADGTPAVIRAQGVFVEIGLIPNSGIVKGLVDMNEYGEILVDSACRTSRPGIFAAGDITTVPFKQIIVAAGEGAKAALTAYDYLLREVG